MYEEELKYLREHENPEDETNFERVKLTELEIAALNKNHPGLPKDYINYLNQIGWGSFRECQFAVFEPIFYLENALSGYEGPDLKRYLAFGHNFSGDTSVFDTKENYRVMEYWHSSSQFINIQKSFKQYIRGCMLIDAEDQNEQI